VGSLTRVQRSIIVGKLLGDGALRRKTNTLLEVNHSVHQSDYVIWVYEALKNLILTPPKLRKSGVDRMSMRFTTRSLAVLNDFYDEFYSKKGYKSVPASLTLDPLSLAIWFMDDGSKDRSSVYLNTQQFDLEDQHLLLAKLSELDIHGSLNKDKSYQRIRIYKSSLNRFDDIVRPHILESMKYKLLL